jgi:hypothetical protein
MRYAAVNQTLDVLARYGNYVPATGTNERPPRGRPGVLAQQTATAMPNCTP